MKRGYTLIEFLIVLAIVGICAVLLVPVYKRVRKNSSHSSCATNQKQIGLGFLQYAQDYDEHLPPAAMAAARASRGPGAAPFGWVDALQPYVQSYVLFHCPENEVARPEDSTQANLTDYYLNLKLAGRNSALVRDPAAVIVVGEGNDGRDLSNSRYARSNVPPGWATDPNSPLLRHRGDRDGMKLGGYYVFLDGHAKYLEGSSPPFGLRMKPVAPPKKRVPQR